MKNSFLKIDTRIFTVAYGSKFTYSEESYMRWTQLNHKSCQEEELNDSEKKELASLEAVSCEEHFFASKISITDTQSQSRNKIANTFSITAHDLEQLNDHIKENTTSTTKLAKDVYQILCD